MAFLDELPLVGGIFGSIFGDPEEDAHQKALKKAVQDMYKYRPEVMDARMNAMGTMSHAFEPLNGLLGQINGGAPPTDMSKLIQNPFSPEAIARMRGQANPTQQKPLQPLAPQLGPDGRPLQGRDWSPPKNSNGGR